MTNSLTTDIKALLADETFANQLVGCYAAFSSEVKPLLAEIESLSERLPIELLNEVRAFNDHIVRCFSMHTELSEAEVQIEKAQRHLSRLILDCFKHIIISYNEEINSIEKSLKNIDTTLILDGKFQQSVSEQKLNAVKLTRTAKLKETTLKDDDEKYRLYESAYNAYFELYNYYQANIPNIDYAKKRYSDNKRKVVLVKVADWVIGGAIGIILTIIVSGVIG